MNSDEKRMVGDYIVEKEIGSGPNGKVWMGYHKSSRLPVAIKIISRRKLSNNKENQTSTKIDIEKLKSLSHPNLVRLYDIKVHFLRKDMPMLIIMTSFRSS